MRTAQAGDVYKYVDETWHHALHRQAHPGAVLVSTGSQRPPEVAAAQLRRATRPPPTASSTASNQRIAEGQDNSRVAANVAKDLEASRAERCKKARDALPALDQLAPHVPHRPDGKREYLTDDRTRAAAHGRRQGGRSHLRPARLKLPVPTCSMNAVLWTAFSFVALAPDNSRLCSALALRVSVPWVLPWRKISIVPDCSKPSGIAAAIKRSRSPPSSAANLPHHLPSLAASGRCRGDLRFRGCGCPLRHRRPGAGSAPGRAGHRLLHGERRNRALGGKIPRRTSAQFIDAPVSGGVEGAQKGTLAIMTGGDPAAFEARAPHPRGDGQDDRALRSRGRGPGHQGHQPDHVRRHHPRLRRSHGVRRRAPVAARTRGVHARRRRRLELVLRASRAEHGARQLSGRLPHQAARQGSRASAATWRRASACRCRWSIRCSPNTRELMEQGYGDEDISATHRLKQALFEDAAKRKA